MLPDQHNGRTWVDATNYVRSDTFPVGVYRIDLVGNWQSYRSGQGERCTYTTAQATISLAINVASSPCEGDACLTAANALFAIVELDFGTSTDTFFVPVTVADGIKNPLVLSGEASPFLGFAYWVELGIDRSTGIIVAHLRVMYGHADTSTFTSFGTGRLECAGVPIAAPPTWCASRSVCFDLPAYEPTDGGQLCDVFNESQGDCASFLASDAGTRSPKCVDTPGGGFTRYICP